MFIITSLPNVGVVKINKAEVNDWIGVNEPKQLTLSHLIMCRQMARRGSSKVHLLIFNHVHVATLYK